jgi:hypothetical protein
MPKPSEINTQTQEAVADATAQTAPAPDLTPAQVTPATGNAATADIPTGTGTPANQPAPDGADSQKGQSSAGTQPVPTNGKPASSAETQMPAPGAAVDAAALFEQVKDLPPGELDVLIQSIEAELDEGDDGESVDLDEPSTSPNRGTRSASDDEPVGYARLDAGSRKAIGAVHSHMVEQAITAALDSDEELSYNMKQAGEKAQESAKSIIRDRLQRMVDERGDRFDYDWGTAAKQAVTAEKPRLTPFLERPARPGMGPGSGGEHHVNRELKEPERVPAFADDQSQDEYLMERMRYNQALIEREQSGAPGA